MPGGKGLRINPQHAMLRMPIIGDGKQLGLEMNCSNTKGIEQKKS